MYLDAGTNNQALLNDPLYLGLRQPRPSQEELFSFVDEFVDAVQEVFPNCCIHFEDWTGADAIHLLERYRDRVSCYNDDIQGTAGITVTGLINAMKVTGQSFKDQRILFLGAGSAGVGIANLVGSAMVKEGLSEEQAYRWSKGKALYAAGVPFPPVQYDGQTLLPGQANNFYIFPAVGMAIYATQPKRVTDDMFIEAAKGVADQVTPQQLKQGLLYPLQSDMLEIETKAAIRVAQYACDQNLAKVERPKDIDAFIRSHVYKPEYQKLI